MNIIKNPGNYKDAFEVLIIVIVYLMQTYI